MTGLGLRKALCGIGIAAALAAAGVVGDAPAAEAADYPAKTIQIYVAFGPGGPTDILARAMAENFNKAWGQPVIVENRPGGGGSIGLSDVAHAAPDGYTLLVDSDSFSIAPAIYAHLPFNAEKDFAPVALLARAANVVVVAPGSPYKTLQELIKAGATPGKLSYTTPGVGSATQMQAAIFCSMANIKDPVSVNFRSTAHAIEEVMGGRGDFIFAPMANAYPLIKAGKLRALAITTSTRSDLLPNVPTIAEAGVPGYSEQQWWGMFAPANTPKPVLEKIEHQVQVALTGAKMRKLISGLSSSPGDLVGDGFAKLVNESIAADTAAAKAHNIHVE